MNEKKYKNDSFVLIFPDNFNHPSNFIFSLIKRDNTIFNALTFLFFILNFKIIEEPIYYHNIFAIIFVFILLYNYQTKNIIFYFSFYKYYSHSFSISTSQQIIFYYNFL